MRKAKLPTKSRLYIAHFAALTEVTKEDSGLIKTNFFGLAIPLPA